MKNFKDVISEIQSSKMATDIIVGNGFSEGLFNDGKLLYSSLIEKVKEATNHASLSKLIKNNQDKYQNLEYYLKLMHDSSKCIPFLYGSDYLTISKFNKEKLISDLKVLKEIIFDTINTIHPETWVSKRQEMENCAKNLTSFHRVYSINYDLILYWVILYCNKLQDKNKFIDGMYHKAETSRPNLECPGKNGHQFS